MDAIHLCHDRKTDQSVAMALSLMATDAILFRQLADLGAGDFRHLNGSLEQHFLGVREMLVSWGADETLTRAGLFHAAYGTAGFTPVMISLDRRGDISRLIGSDAEEIVYTYCACDRESVWPQIGQSDDVIFRDRFTGKTRLIAGGDLRQFCELTCANEIEIASKDPQFIAQYGGRLGALFGRWGALLSASASGAVAKTFALPLNQ
jgi:hypothetical protein